MENILNKAIEAVQTSEVAFCKFLSANDTKATKSHQSGYLIGVSAWSLFLDKKPDAHIIKHNAKIKWQDDFETSATFTYYKSKGELRLTGFGKKFPFREEDNVGDLFILTKKTKEYFEGYILQSSEDIDDFFAAVNISSTQTNAIIPKQFDEKPEDKLLKCFHHFLLTLKQDFPPTIDLATTARNCYINSFSKAKNIIQKNPDQEILNWLETEFKLFKTIENDRYSSILKSPFASVEDLITSANTILNRRKSRAGKSLEHHLSEIFNCFELQYSSQSITEDNKKPDFLFPGSDSYHNPLFDNNKLISLASKTTCKDRWRQILNEADKIKTKHLFTLQQGISKNQLQEMYKYDVCLVVPEPFLKNFPIEFRDKILTLENFVHHVKKTQM
ncbi:type II restriction endonuclease [Flavobacterium sp. LHD-85]|uniref:type II restriction endonuclease n=1 Tax=Flavobacterium sp. LHD-85 TaxID=3071410 RepID=UPI0027E0A1BD|nr:type II restriction endonuclease [Flavobacterium sp. LHD-85]MDQ6528276.1 type II restriction endonuclease [Flavobacterium sp. LHD-85]